MINIKGGNHIGWGETKVSSNQPDFDLSAWSEEFKKLKGMKLGEAIEEVRNQFLTGNWKPIVTEGLLMTLYDLMGKIENKLISSIFTSLVDVKDEQEKTPGVRSSGNAKLDCLKNFLLE